MSIKVLIETSDFKDLTKFLNKMWYNEESDEPEYYNFEVLFLRDRYIESEKFYLVSFTRINPTENGTFDYNDYSLYFDVNEEEFDVKSENKIIKLIKSKITENDKFSLLTFKSNYEFNNL
jgi:hypothetical protein